MSHAGPEALPDSFHPLVRSWFVSRYGTPTPVQSQAWPIIEGGGHVLASAPTGSGKTLTAFLGALSRFATGEYPETGLSVLYISPLKALNEDVRINLLAPLRELSAWFCGHGEQFQRLRVASRSGDTGQAERRGMISKPPAILCTTPESLAILLSSRSGLGLLSGVRLLILDEIHAVLGTKRGSALASSVGRLVSIAGEFQRVALSATLKPFDEAARFVGAARLVRGEDGKAGYEPRPVAVVAPRTDKRYELSVAWPDTPPGDEEPGSGGRYAAIVADLSKRLGGESSTLVFTDSRRRAERLASMLNERCGEGAAFTHHGSLSKELRKAVEAGLKEGRLRCVVATGSLELGIDVGAIDLVVLAGTPARTDQLLQRAGRAGHGVGLASRAIIYPFHGLDLLASAAALGAALEGDIDPLAIPRSPLDVLAQTLLSMVLFEERSVDGLYDEVRSFAPFTDLSRADFDAVVGMLAGRYEGSRIKELRGRVYLDEEQGSLRAREGSAMLLYSSGGSIPDRGYYSMRLAGSGARIGELDEEFVFERRVGNSFSFGSQAWRIVSIGDEAVEVLPLDREADFMPFWKAEKPARGSSVSRRMLELCAAWQDDPEGFAGLAASTLGFSGNAARALSDFLASQARSQGQLPLPSGRQLPVESFRDPDRKAGSHSLVIHSLRGARINEPLGMALAVELEAILGIKVERLSDDDSVSFALPLADHKEAEAALRSAFATLANPLRLIETLHAVLGQSAAFGAAFRENAGRALLLPRSGFGKRKPLWVTRLKAKRLFEKVGGASDFPLTRESVKNVLEERFDLPALLALLEAVGDGSVALGFFCPRAPSPFARQSGWAETNRYLYEGDSMPGAGALPPASGAGVSGARDSRRSAGDAAILAALGDQSLWPRLDSEFVAGYARKLRRELPGWAPESTDALAEWVDERVAIPLAEWEALLASCQAELARAAREALADPDGCRGLVSRLVIARLPEASVDVVIRRERLAALSVPASTNAPSTGPAPGAPIPCPAPDGARLDIARLDAAATWLASTGPVSLARLAAIFGLDQEAPDIMESLRARGAVPLEDGRAFGGLPGRPWIAALEVLESLLRLARRAARSSLSPRPGSELPAFLASLQELRDHGRPGPADDQRAMQDLRRALSTLSGYPAPAALWETELLPARVRAYRPYMLDEVLAAGEYIWYGCGRETLAFASARDFEAFAPCIRSRIFEPDDPPMDAWAIKDRRGLSVTELEKAMWTEIWAGAIGSDSFEAIRKGVVAGFKPVAASVQGPGDDASAAAPASNQAASRPAGRGRIPRALAARWKGGAPVPGLWFPLSSGEYDSIDKLHELELAMTTIRALVRRYGFVCKAFVDREASGRSWSSLFVALRRLELSGELVSGSFFTGLDGPQFMGREALALFRGGYKTGRIWSVNALDPASPCGIALAGHDSAGPTADADHDSTGPAAGTDHDSAGPAAGAGHDSTGPAAATETALPDKAARTPARIPSNRLSLCDDGTLCVFSRSWHEVSIHVDPDSPLLEPALACALEARHRPVNPERRLVIETINGQRAAHSPYAGLFLRLGFEADRGLLTLW